MPLCAGMSCPPGDKGRYKGTEPSPKGRGFCAHCAPVGQQLTGEDGLEYVVAQRANGSHYWKKLPGQGKAAAPKPAAAKKKKKKAAKKTAAKKKKKKRACPVGCKPV